MVRRYDEKFVFYAGDDEDSEDEVAIGGGGGDEDDDDEDEEANEDLSLKILQKALSRRAVVSSRNKVDFDDSNETSMADLCASSSGVARFAVVNGEKSEFLKEDTVKLTKKNVNIEVDPAQENGPVYYWPVAPPGAIRGPYPPHFLPYRVNPGPPSLSPDQLELREKIIKQIEYYFSDENLQTDGYLISLMDKQGWIPVATVSDFKRVKKMTTDMAFIIYALQFSASVEVQGDKIRRRDNWSTWVPASKMMIPAVASFPPNEITTEQIQKTTVKEGRTMHSEGWQIIHISGKPQVPPDCQPTVDVYASVVEPKSANTLVRHLCRIAPLEDLRHVKRVRKKTFQEQGETKLTAILCLAPQHEGQPNNLPPEIQNLVYTYKLSPFITKVCKYAATSKEEWEEQCKLWPTSYHPPSHNVDGIGGFSEEDSRWVCIFMKLVIDLAVSVNKPLVNAAVIVDPSVRKVIASGTDQVALRNINISETICFKESGGSIHPQSVDGDASNSTKKFFKGTTYKPKGSNFAVACSNPWQWSLQQNQVESFSQWHPLRHATIVAIESSSARDRYFFSSLAEIHGQDHHTQSSGVHSSAKKQKTGSQSLHVQSKNSEEAVPLMERPYLCTGYDIFLLWEPCTMCAMALVHQRVKRVFYAIPNPKAGGVGSVHRLQGETRLNHQYSVFRVVLPQELLGMHPNLLSAVAPNEPNGDCHSRPSV